MDKESDYDAREFLTSWSVTICVILLISLLNLLDPSTINQLALRHSDVQQGEWWRIITGQFVHLGGNHTILNITGYFIICFAFRKEMSPVREVITLVLAATGTGLGVYWYNPELSSYVGMSGAIYGLIVSNVITSFRKTPFLSALFILFLISKFTWEQSGGTADSGIENFIGGRVAIDSHLFGALTGLITGVGWLIWSRLYRPS